MALNVLQYIADPDSFFMDPDSFFMDPVSFFMDLDPRLDVESGSGSSFGSSSGSRSES